MSHIKRIAFYGWSTLISFFLLQSASLSYAEESSALKRIHVMSDSLLGNRLVLMYYSVGILNDLTRAKKYPSEKTKRYLLLLKSMISSEAQFLKSISDSRRQKINPLFRKVHGCVDLLHESIKAFYEYMAKGQIKAQERFQTYRNAVAKDIGELLGAHSAKKSVYPYNSKQIYRYLEYSLGRDAVLAFFLQGLVADGYFVLFLKKNKVYELLRITTEFMHISTQKTKDVALHMSPQNHALLKKVSKTTFAVFQQGKALKQYIHSGNRAFLEQYKKWRTQSWNSLHFLRSS